MKLNFRINKTNDTKECEYCGSPILEPYVIEVNDEKHYFCCSHCADAWRKEHS